MLLERYNDHSNRNENHHFSYKPRLLVPPITERDNVFVIVSVRVGLWCAFKITQKVVDKFGPNSPGR